MCSGVELELVPGRAGGEHGPERLPELRDVDLNGMRGRLRRVARPERLHEAIDRDDAARLERERGEERPRLRASERHGRSRSPDVDRAEEAYFELWGACPGRSVHSSSLGTRVRTHFLTRAERISITVLSRS